MKKMVKVAALAAMVLSVALTGCGGKKGDASSSNAEASEKSNSTAVGRKQIDAFLKNYEKFVEKAESAANKGNKSSLEALQKEAVKLFGEDMEKSAEFVNSSEWTESDTANIFQLTIRYNAAISQLQD